MGLCIGLLISLTTMSVTMTVTTERLSTEHIQPSDGKHDKESSTNEGSKLLSKAGDIPIEWFKKLMQSDGLVWRFPIDPYDRTTCNEEHWPAETGVKGAAFCSTRSDELDRIEEMLYPKQMYLPEGKGAGMTKGEILNLSNSYITILFECAVAGANLEAGSNQRFVIQELPESSFDCPSLNSPYAKSPFSTDKQQVIVDASDARYPIALAISAYPIAKQDIMAGGYAIRSRENELLAQMFAQACTRKLSKHQGVILNHLGANVRFIEHPKGSLLKDATPHQLEFRYAFYVFPDDRHRFVEDMAALILNYNDYKSVFTFEEPVAERWNKKRKKFTRPDPDPIFPRPHRQE